MIWPQFKTSVAFAGSEKIMQLVLQEKCSKPLLEKGYDVSLLEIDKKDIIPKEGFLFFASWINLYLTEDFIVNEFDRTSKFYGDYAKQIEELFGMIGREPYEVLSETIRAATYTIFYKLNDGKILLFQLNNDKSAALVSMFNKSLHFVSALLSGMDPAIAQSIEESYSYNNQIYYVGEVEAHWQVIDPLLYMAERINENYMEHGDLRTEKPHIILQEDDLSRKHSFGGNWVLEFDGLSTILDRPNDVAIYSSICEKNLSSAKRFYEDTILIRHQYYSGNFPIPQQQREYMDYFELITTSLIFAYSSIEAFVNSFIPNGYTYTKPNGTKVLDKEYIERYFSMTEKLKTIFTDIYQTPDPEKEQWWQRLAELQELRNQTIHTKQHFSQTRYSKLLSRDIFDTIAVYKVIISYYGSYIMKKDKYLINDFPYNFGFDQVFPSLMSDGTYRDIYNSLHNPSSPL